MRDKLLLPLLTISAGLFLIFSSGCNTDNSVSSEEANLQIDSLIANPDIFNEISDAKKIFYALPSPIETAIILKSAGAKYNEDLMNPTQNVENYTTNQAMALNLGIYTTDLSFASLFDQTQASINYMEAAREMANGLGILDAINNNTMMMLEENINNRDVIMDIISETFMSTSAFLKENDREALSAVVLVGGWVEGLFISTQLIQEEVNLEENKLAVRTMEQKLSLDIVKRLLELYQEHPDVAPLIVLIDDLSQTFDKVEIKSTPVNVEMSEGDQPANLKSVNEVTFSPQTFLELKEKVKTIRSNFIL